MKGLFKKRNFSKYLFYTLGEFILVVIGILSRTGGLQAVPGEEQGSRTTGNLKLLHSTEFEIMF